MFCSAVLLVGANVLLAHVDDKHAMQLWLKEWESVIHPLNRDSELLHAWLRDLDPRPDKAFVKFTREKLDPRIVAESKQWCKTFFKAAADPYRGGLKGPTHYSLAPDATRRSLLLYQWQTKTCSFTLMEGANVVLLRVKPTDKPLVLKPVYKDGQLVQSGESEERVVDLLKRLLSRRVVGDPAVGLNFQLGDSIGPGRLYTNAERPSAPLPRDWAKCVLLFLTDDDLCLMLGKANPYLAQAQERAEDRWLAPALFDKDGKTLMIEKLWGKPFPRPGDSKSAAPNP
jgi:hypothetical protein